MCKSVVYLSAVLYSYTLSQLVKLSLYYRLSNNDNQVHTYVHVELVLVTVKNIFVLMILEPFIS
jgi:hypothetical protein